MFIGLSLLRRALKTVVTVLLEIGCDFEARMQDPPTLFLRRPFLKTYLKFMGVDAKGVVIAGYNFRILKPGTIKIGNYVSFGPNCTINNHGSIEIGSDVMIASGLCINTGTHHVESLVPRNTKVVIGDHVWIGASVTIVEDTSVSSGCVVAAGSLVRGCYKENSLIAGVPSRFVRLIHRQSEVNCWMPGQSHIQLPLKPS